MNRLCRISSSYGPTVKSSAIAAPSKVKRSLMPQQPLSYGGNQMIVTEYMLTESKTARDGQIQKASNERAEQILGKVKGLMFAMWQGTGTATTEQMAEYFEVPIDTVRSAAARHKEEFASDGLREARGKELKSLRGIGHDAFQLPESTTRLTIWTPRAALRLAMVLRDSPIALAARNAILDAVEIIPAQQHEIEKLKLELELAKAQRSLMDSVQMLEAISPGLAPLALGKSDAVVERVEVVERVAVVDEKGRTKAQTSGQSKTTVAKALGMKKPQELIDWLKSINRVDLIEEGVSIVHCQYVPYEKLKEIKRLWSQRRGSRQKLIGES